MSRDDDPRLNMPVSASWVLVQLAGMRFLDSSGTDAYDYMKRALLAQPAPKSKRDRTLQTLTAPMMHVLHFADRWGKVCAGNTYNNANGQIVKINPAVIHALARRGYLELIPGDDLTGEITAAGRKAYSSQ